MTMRMTAAARGGGWRVLRQDDLSVKKQSAFPSWFAGQGPDVEKDPLAFKKLSAEYVERLQEDHNIDPSKVSPS